MWSGSTPPFLAASRTRPRSCASWTPRRTPLSRRASCGARAPRLALLPSPRAPRSPPSPVAPPRLHRCRAAARSPPRAPPRSPGPRAPARPEQRGAPRARRREQPHPPVSVSQRRARLCRQPGAPATGRLERRRGQSFARWQRRRGLAWDGRSRRPWVTCSVLVLGARSLALPAVLQDPRARGERLCSRPSKASIARQPRNSGPAQPGREGSGCPEEWRARQATEAVRQCEAVRESAPARLRVRGSA
jgi:hypothetical protein